MCNDELRKKINQLKELLDLKDFINDSYDDDYKITIKRTILGIENMFTEKTKLIVSRAVLEKIVSSLIENLKKEVETHEEDEENDEWKDICELFNDSRYKFSNKQNGMTEEDRRLLDSNFDVLGEIINQIIKNQKYLRKKLEEKK